MDKLQRATETARGVVGQIATGFAQMASIAPVRPPSVFPARTDADALRGDWVKVGADLSRGIEKVREVGKTR